VGGPTTGAALAVTAVSDGGGPPAPPVAHDVLTAIASAMTKNALQFIDSPFRPESLMTQRLAYRWASIYGPCQISASPSYTGSWQKS
jgi:hypothetical protein